MNKEYLDLLEMQARADLRIAIAKASVTPIQMIIKKHPEIKGYTLLQEYPGCNRKVGDFEPYTTGEFSKYPNIWKPVYHKEVEREKKLNQLLGE